jgi:hypothetical protein
MKWLKIYEAFRSRGISSTLKFLKEKVGVNGSNRFLKTLKNFMSEVNYPIDKISDNDLIYIRAEKAKMMKNEEEPQNTLGLYYIKFWFSIKDGFLGYTGTGRKNKLSSDTKREQKKFPEEQFDYIKDNIVSTGKLYPVTDYNKLKTGDVVLGCFNDNFINRYIGLARVFIDLTDNSLYAIQGVSDGSTPGNRDWRDYTDYGYNTWWIGDFGKKFGNDHSHLYWWVNSDEELHFVDVVPEDSEGVKPEENVLEFNLPLTSEFKYTSWGRGSISLDGFNNSDFALVLKYDDMVNPDKAEFFETPSDVRKLRREEKSGATKLMTDSDIRNINVERWVKKLSDNFDIVGDNMELSNLKNLVKKDLLSEFSYIEFVIGYDSKLSDYIRYLYHMIDDNEISYLNEIKGIYKRRNDIYFKKLFDYRSNQTVIKNGNIKKIFDEFINLGKEINNKFSNMEVNTIDDLFKIDNQLNSLNNFIRLERNRLEYNIRYFLVSLSSNYSTCEAYYKDFLLNFGYNDEQYKSDLVKIERIKSYLRSL